MRHLMSSQLDVYAFEPATPSISRSRKVAFDGGFGGAANDGDVGVGFPLGDPEEDSSFTRREVQLLLERGGGIKVGREAPGLGDLGIEFVFAGCFALKAGADGRC